MEESSCYIIRGTTQAFAWRTDENYKESRSDIRCSSRDSTWEPQEYKSGASPLEPINIDEAAS
jgi:hypothetical protein